MEKHRARNEDQKQQRRLTLIETARELFEQTAYEAVTMAGVAEKAGLAKGTVFFYFKTKEELFLTVQEQLLEDWFTEIDGLLAGVSGAERVEQVVRLLGQSLQGRASLTRLLAILHTTLEQNVDFDSTLRFKQFLGTHLLRTGRLLEQALPFLAKGQGSQVLLRIDAFIIGLQHLSNPGPVTRRVLAEVPGMKMFEIDFYHELTQTIQALLYGMEAD